MPSVWKSRTRSNLPALLELIARRAGALLGTDLGIVWLWDALAEVLVPQAWLGYAAGTGTVRLRPGEDVAGAVAERRQGILVNDYPTSLLAHPELLRQAPVHACVGEPLLYGDRFLGVITIARTDPKRPFAEQDRDILALLAAQAVLAIENVHLAAASERAQREGRLFAKVVAELNASLDLDTVLSQMATAARDLCGSDLAQLALREADSDDLLFRYLTGTRYADYERVRIAPGKGIGGYVTVTGRPFRTANYAEDPG